VQPRVMDDVDALCLNTLEQLWKPHLVDPFLVRGRTSRPLAGLYLWGLTR
jgi:hypothetical protein